MADIDPAWLEGYAAAAGALVATVGVVIVVLQLRNLERSVSSAAHAAIYARAAEFRAHLIAHPHLRKYFFDGVEIAADHDDHDRAATIAELYLNYLEHIAVTADSLGRRNRPALDRFIAGAFANAPILRDRVADQSWGYSEALIRRAARPEQG